MNCPICSAVVDDQKEHCPQCGFNLQLGPRAEPEPVSGKEAPPPEPPPAAERAEAAKPVLAAGEPPTPADKGALVTPCERCGESRVDAIFRCGRRASGDCPYQEHRRSWGDRQVGCRIIGAAIALGAALFIYLGGVVMDGQAAVRAVGIVMVAGGILVLSARQESLIHSVSKAQLKRVTLWGRELRRELITALERIPLHLPLDKPLHYPPSVAALATQDGKSVVRAAVIGLLADGKIGALVYHTHRLRPDGAAVRSHRAFVFKQGSVSDRTWITRYWLEEALLREFVEGKTVEKAVYAILKSSSDPGSWLVKQVQQVAVRRGWGRWESRMGIPFVKRYEPNPEHTDSMARERAIMGQLAQALDAQHPALSTVLDQEIRRAFDSRTRTNDPC